MQTDPEVIRTGLPAADWQVWQLIDSAFPVGSFVHSGGLEAAAQHNVVRSADTLRAFSVASLTNTASLAAPFMLAVHGCPASASRFDKMYNAALQQQIANDASRAQGVALLSTARNVWPTLIGQIVAISGDIALLPHWPTAWGLVTRAISVRPQLAIEMMLFVHLRMILSAAVRLNLVGPIEAQQLASDLMTANMGRLTAVAMTTSVDDAAGTAPMIDLLQAQHDKLYSRLFVS